MNSAEGTERVVEHTKGPWTAHPYNARMGTLISFGDISKGETIGNIFAQKDGEEGKANGRLMAEAPELLGALKDQLQLMVGYKSRLECDGAYVAARQVGDRIEMVTAVIAKAEAKS